MFQKMLFVPEEAELRRLCSCCGFQRKKQMLVVFVILVCVSHHASAVDIHEGDWFLLPCEFPTFDVVNPTVVWSRPDLSPSTVHQRQQDGDELKDQNQLYRGRTSMSTDALKTGDLSLNLTGLKLSDNGTYTCSVTGFRFLEKVTNVHLQVKEQFPSWVKAPLVLLTIILVVAVGLLVYFRQYFMAVNQVEVESGEESVLLPCKTTVCLPADIRVVWTDRENRTVHVYQNGSDQQEEQHTLYNGRTEMKRTLLRPGDVSLKNPTYKDRGTFTCTIYSSEGNVLLKKQVHLWVKVQRVKVDSGEGSALLPCKATVHLPEDVRVESRDSKIRTVHVHQNGSDKPEEQDSFYRGRTEIRRNLLRTGHFSLSLKNPTDEDADIFTCTVYNSEGNILMKKQVHLWVSVQQVVVKLGEKSVLLPCEASIHLPEDVRVAWTDSKKRTVHVYQNGSDQPEEQDHIYKGRTEMKRNLLKPGDVSLKNPTDGDTDIFTCTIYNREGNIIMKKQVDLKVKVQQVEVKLGEESVLLPCKTTVHLPEDVRVKWTDSKNRAVHVYENGSDQPEEQHSHYRGRTEMKRNLLRTGDVSVRLKNPTDGDMFTCAIYNKEGIHLMKKQVELLVSVQQVEVESGEESVLLPCKTTVHLPEDVRVEWRDSDDDMVHVYQNGDQPEEQHSHYIGRTEMKRNLLRTGDVSVRLKNPTDKDTYTFTCTVYSSQRRILMKKQVELKVKVHQVEVDSGEESALLPCKATVHLPEDVRVEWRDSKNRTVHVHQNGSDTHEEQHSLYRGRTEMKRTLLRIGDISVRLKNPTDEDTGTFTCTVYNREGNIMINKPVILQVKAGGAVIADLKHYILKTTWFASVDKL
ncbi:uncharacterized protein LOC114867978 isoform X2 [Betta splendens]|uniref:Uncharacterized protein LOC114867978 isoform X2 n=1 Tax=Betta splendens TaxID=158456 RepID=A0A9W2Y6B0_BETSP|nr:uncharacterized protein LOC114867978 isoform X2 [Betta splendens]